jgi:hypothetical protein
MIYGINNLGPQGLEVIADQGTVLPLEQYNIPVKVVEVGNDEKVAYEIQEGVVTRSWTEKFPNREIQKERICGTSQEGLADTFALGDDFYLSFKTVVVPKNTPTVGVRSLVRFDWD